jgi:hypothetical protein
MIIESVIFFFWVLVVLVIGAIAALRMGRKRSQDLQGVDNISPRLSFPQKNWLLLCIIVAILSPLLVSGITAVTHRKLYKESVERNGAAYPAGDSVAKDTSYHVATPPNH